MTPPSPLLRSVFRPPFGGRGLGFVWMAYFFVFFFIILYLIPRHIDFFMVLGVVDLEACHQLRANGKI